MAETKKILFLSDNPLVPSGVGTQAKYLIEGLLATGKYSFFCMGGALRHENKQPVMVSPDKYGDRWKILPVDGHGDKNVMRQLLIGERPDAVFMFTDPRFFEWLWEMEDEVRAAAPLVYWHVWDNDPTPDFNRTYYESTDFISALSLKTYGLLQDIGYPADRFNYIPHSLPTDMFRPVDEEKVQEYKRAHFGPHADRKFVLFWNNRNARRKVTGDVVATFAKFAKRVGRDNVSLMMHTDPKDPEGQDIIALGRQFDVEKNLIISDKRLPTDDINMFYNACDTTVNISSNEGFGLGTLESLLAGTPIVVHMTGGLQFQIGDWWKDLKKFTDQDKLAEIAKRAYQLKAGKWFGEPVFPAARTCTGNQRLPYIYDDRVAHEDVVDALERMYRMGREKRRALGLQAREWALETFNRDKMISDWDSTLESQIEKFKKSGGPKPRVITL